MLLLLDKESFVALFLTIIYSKTFLQALARNFKHLRKLLLSGLFFAKSLDSGSTQYYIGYRSTLLSEARQSFISNFASTYISEFKAEGKPLIQQFRYYHLPTTLAHSNSSQKIYARTCKAQAKSVDYYCENKKAHPWICFGSLMFRRCILPENL